MTSQELQEFENLKKENQLLKEKNVIKDKENKNLKALNVFNSKIIKDLDKGNYKERYEKIIKKSNDIKEKLKVLKESEDIDYKSKYEESIKIKEELKQKSNELMAKIKAIQK